ncbi:MAG: hypothetical protein RL748_619, partial [Pseudomonadota bacterium]
KITVLGALPYFTGTTANGLTTASYPASWCGMQLALDAPPTISVSHSPNPLVAGQSFTMNWRSSNASTISYACSNGGGLVLSGSSQSATGTVNASALAGWVSDAPVCSWTATGSSGASANYRDSLSTVTPPPLAPVINSVSRSPATMTAGSPFTVSWNTSNASNMAYTCTPNGGSAGYNGSGSGLVASGNISGTAAAAWAGTSSTCVWTATGAGGATATYRETVATNAAAAEEVVTYIHTDALGSPVARTDANGTLISRTRYEPHGATAAGAVPTIGFTGHVNDANTGLVYMQQRYYDPIAGRFLSTDPVLTDANTGSSFNRYVYANNSPYKYVDPDGRLATSHTERPWDTEQVNGITRQRDPCGGEPCFSDGASAASVAPQAKGNSVASAPDTDTDPNEHLYKWGVFRCLGDCSAKTFLELRLNPAPSAMHKTPVSTGTISKVSLAGGELGKVMTAVSAETKTIWNLTLPGHALHPGWVRRDVVVRNGETWVLNTGGGTGWNPLNMNVILAPLVWGGTSPARVK